MKKMLNEVLPKIRARPEFLVSGGEVFGHTGVSSLEGRSLRPKNRNFRSDPKISTKTMFKHHKMMNNTNTEVLHH